MMNKCVSLPQLYEAYKLWSLKLVISPTSKQFNCHSIILKMHNTKYLEFPMQAKGQLWHETKKKTQFDVES